MQFITVFVALSSIWLGLKISAPALPLVVSWWTDVSPWYSLIIFGCYCLARLGKDLLTYNDYPLEIGKLEQVRVLSN